MLYTREAIGNHADSGGTLCNFEKCWNVSLSFHSASGDDPVFRVLKSYCLLPLTLCDPQGVKVLLLTPSDPVCPSGCLKSCY